MLSLLGNFLTLFLWTFSPLLPPVSVCSAFPELGLVNLLLIMSRELGQQPHRCLLSAPWHLSLAWKICFRGGGRGGGSSLTQPARWCCQVGFPSPELPKCPRDLAAGFPDSEGSKRPRQKQPYLSDPPSEVPHCHSCSLAAQASQLIFAVGRDDTRPGCTEAKILAGHLGGGYPMTYWYWLIVLISYVLFYFRSYFLKFIFQPLYSVLFSSDIFVYSNILIPTTLPLWCPIFADSWSFLSVDIDYELLLFF